MLFSKVDDVKTKGLIARDIANTEEEPLIIPTCIDVILQDEVILMWFSLINTKEVA